MPVAVWIGFVAFILLMLFVDLGVFHRRPHAISIREALRWTVMWVAVALAFNLGLYFLYDLHWFGIGTGQYSAHSGSQAAMEFLAGFLVEKSLSLDNIFVIALIFAYFRVALAYQHRVLFWGILGVLVLRGAMIATGVAMNNAFGWMNYVFAALLIVSAIKMLRSGDEEFEPARNPLVRIARRLYPVSSSYEGGRFFTTLGGQPAITPLFIVLLVVESTDLVFAFDSIPAVIAVTKDPFLVFTSNVFAVLGLRSLYFVLAGILHRFRHLKTSLFLILLYVGVKMLLVHVYQVDVVVSLVVIIGILAVGALASSNEPREPEPKEEEEEERAAASQSQAGPVERRTGKPSAERAAPDAAIHAVNVTKYYGRQRGITDFSATIPRGALVGLLGPNGAGKTTAIRILSCHMPPTTGTVHVCGYDVFSQSLQVRKRLGYLPENCPLYPEMHVLEYLRWTAQMKGMRGSDVDRAVFQILDPCGIEGVRTQTIGTLSKGYRQRVGLAAALIHRPDVLILDEPTVGLDPLQAREFRSLIGSLKGKHTVLISSHILSEIEVICDSVVILNQGRVVASGAPDTLRGGVAPIYAVECRLDPALKALVPQLVRGLAGSTLEHYEEADGFARFRLSTSGEDPRIEIFRRFSQAGIEIREMTQERITLEDVFVQYTRKSPEIPAEPALAEVTA